MLTEEIIKEIKDDLKSCDDLMYKYTERHFDLSVNTLSYIEQLEQREKELIEMVYRLLYLLEDGGGFILIEEYEKYKNDTYKQIEKFFNKKWEEIINE